MRTFVLLIVSAIAAAGDFSVGSATAFASASAVAGPYYPKRTYYQKYGKKDETPIIIVPEKKDKGISIVIVDDVKESPVPKPERSPKPAAPEPVPSPRRTRSPRPSPETTDVPEEPAPEVEPVPRRRNRNRSPKPSEPTPSPRTRRSPRPQTTECSDVPPDSEYTCAEQASFGRCNAPFMNGFCLATCEKC